MSNIQTFLEKILSARYGKDVRQSIHDAIHQCYEDGKAGSVDLTAREEIGVIEELTTGVKDTIVKAINWLNNSLTTLSNSLVALAKRVGANETAISDLNTKTNGLYSDLSRKCDFELLKPSDFTYEQEGTTGRFKFLSEYYMQNKLVLFNAILYSDDGLHGACSMVMYAGNYYGSTISKIGTNNIASDSISGSADYQGVQVKIDNLNKTITKYSIECKIIG